MLKTKHRLGSLEIACAEIQEAVVLVYVFARVYCFVSSYVVRPFVPFQS
jgi:hypothetical protein